MVLAQLGWKSCAPTGGEGSDAANFLAALSLSRNIIIGDNDPDPQVREKMVRYAQHRAVLFSAILRYPPEGFKDIDEFILADSDAKNLLDKWIQEVE